MLAKGETSDTIGMRGSVCYTLEEDIKVPETPMHLKAKGNSVTWPVDIGTFDQMDYANVEHVEDGDCSFSRFVLFWISLYLI